MGLGFVLPCPRFQDAFDAFGAFPIFSEQESDAFQVFRGFLNAPLSRVKACFNLNAQPISGSPVPESLSEPFPCWRLFINSASAPSKSVATRLL